MTKFVSYFRVSTQRQGASGLGLDAQRADVMRFVGEGEIVGEFVEIESGRKSDRPKLREALALARKSKAKLVIAKLDRLARNVHFISGLMESGVDFIAVDRPFAKPFELHIYAAMAEEEARAISARTKAALAAKKAQGAVLGNRTNLADAQAKGRAKGAERAAQYRANVLPIIDQVRAAGVTTLHGIAIALTARGVRTPRGGTEWHPMTVQRLLAA